MDVEISDNARNLLKDIARTTQNDVGEVADMAIEIFAGVYKTQVQGIKSRYELADGTEQGDFISLDDAFKNILLDD